MTRSAMGRWLRRRTGHGAETLARRRRADRVDGAAGAGAEPGYDGTAAATASPGEQQQLAQEDIEFATKAAQGNLKEVRFGELAQQQAAREEVKQFGQRMVEDHGKAND